VYNKKIFNTVVYSVVTLKQTTMSKETLSFGIGEGFRDLLQSIAQEHLLRFNR
jgi:hypothetical protein